MDAAAEAGRVGGIVGRVGGIDGLAGGLIVPTFDIDVAELTDTAALTLLLGGGLIVLVIDF